VVVIPCAVLDDDDDDDDDVKITDALTAGG